MALALVASGLAIGSARAGATPTPIYNAPGGGGPVTTGSDGVKGETLPLMSRARTAYTWLDSASTAAST